MGGRNRHAPDTHGGQAARCFLLLFLLAGGAVSPAAGQTSRRIMLLGDSITAGFEGSSPVGGYRDDLDSLLAGAGALFDFVGTQNDGTGFDADHEGHGGWTVDMITADIDSFLAAGDPEIVLIHLGTNDLSANQGVPGTLADMDSLLTHIYAYRPSMSVHLAGLIPRADVKDSLATELNAGYALTVDAWRGAGRTIRYVDQNGAFKANPNWLADYLFDHVHPTNAGYAVMAQTWFDSLATEDIFPPPPPVGPDPVTDLAVDVIASRTARLRWTATGDSGSVGTAASYDVRFSGVPITESNFDSATAAVGEPDPLPAGSAEEFTVGGLDPETAYYFALRAIGTSGTPSSLSNVPSGATVAAPVVADAFERAGIGPDWSADSTLVLSGGELVNTSLDETWGRPAVYLPASGLESVALRWGAGVDSAGVTEGGLALMLDAPSPDASGYLIFRHAGFDWYGLWTVEGGAPTAAVAQAPSTLPLPLGGDEFEVVVSSDVHGHHFDCWINGVFDTRVTDPAKLQGGGATFWSGVMLHGNRNNNVDDFRGGGTGAALAPLVFHLLTPADGDTVDTAEPTLDWEDAADPNPGDSILYRLSYGTSAAFAPESTTVVDSLPASLYTIPPAALRLLSVERTARRNARATGDSAVRRAVGRERERTGILRPGGSRGTRPAREVRAMDDGGPRTDALDDGARFYWKVLAFDTAGLGTESAETGWSFTVGLQEPSPYPIAAREPVDGGRVGVFSPRLVWDPVAPARPGGGVVYTLRFGTDSTLAAAREIDGIEAAEYRLERLTGGTRYYWSIEAVDEGGRRIGSGGTWEFSVLRGAGVDPETALTAAGPPRVFALAPNHPNPFNPSTTIRFDIPATDGGEGEIPVRLSVYDVRGRRVRTLLEGDRPPGRHQVHWDGRDEAGAPVASGIYLYRLEAGSFGAMRKMTLAR